jgi:hypothetical protein
MKPTTPLIVTVAASLVALVGFATYLIATGHDPGSFVGTVTTLVALIPSLIGVGVGLSKTQEKVKTIEKNTNGTLSALHATVGAKEAENQALRSVLTPEQISQVAPVAPVQATQPAAPSVDPILVPTPATELPGGIAPATDGFSANANG